MLNDPATVEDVREAFERYEAALVANDADVLDAMFVHRDDTVRFGVAEVQYGIDEIRQFRSMQQPFSRRLERLTIVSYGSDVAVASVLFYRDDFPGHTGRQQQTWLRTPTGWRVAAAHVSMMPQT